MQECDACGLLFGGADECPSCGSRISHVASEDVDDGRHGRMSGPLPGESALDDALDGIAGVDLESPLAPPASASNLPFQMGGEGQVTSTLPFGVGAPSGVIVESEEDLPPAAPEPSPEPVAESRPEADPEIVEDEASDDPWALPVVAAPVIGATVEAEAVAEVGAVAEVDAIAEMPAVAEVAALAEIPSVAEADSTAMLDAVPVPMVAATIDHTPPMQAPEIDAAAALAAGDELIVLTAREVAQPVVEEQLADSPVLFENAYQIKAAAFDTEQVYAVQEDVVFHDFGDELQVSEVVVNFDELVDPAEQTVRFDPSLLAEGEPELMPARALPIDDGGDAAVAGSTIAGFEALGEGRWEDAASLFRNVCNSRPGDASALNDFGLALLQHAIVVHDANPTATPAEEPHFEAAVLSLRQAAQQDKHNPTIMFNLATCLATCGRHGVAVRIWDAAITLAPEDAAPLNGKAVSLVAVGEFDAAAALLMRARDAAPAEPVILRNLRRLRPTA